MTTITDAPRPALAEARGQRPAQSGTSLKYLASSLRYMLGDPAFIGFLLALPAGMYLFFGAVFGQDPEWGQEAKEQILLQMATYGAMGSALAAGTAIQNERSTGWFRQLMLTSLTPARFFGVRVLAALLMIAPPILLLLAIGHFDGIRLPATTWLAILGISLVVLLPFVVMGLVIGLWLRSQTANAATTFLMLGMAMLGGLWVPLEIMPDFMQSIGRLLPSYWAGQFAMLPVSGGDVPMRGVVTLVVWTVALMVLGVLGYRRAVATSKR